MRPEEQFDPEAEADFDRAFEKMMAESLDSRKFERKAQFDVPLPIRKVHRVQAEPNEDEVGVSVESESNTMAFSLMTKKGNRQQVITVAEDEMFWYLVDLLTDHFADEDDRPALRLELCSVDEITTSGRTRGAATNQESSLEL